MCNSGFIFPRLVLVFSLILFQNFGLQFWFFLPWNQPNQYIILVLYQQNIIYIYIYIYIIGTKVDSFEMNELIGFGLNLQGYRCLIITLRYRHLCIWKTNSFGPHKIYLKSNIKNKQTNTLASIVEKKPTSEVPSTKELHKQATRPI